MKQQNLFEFKIPLAISHNNHINGCGDKRTRIADVCLAKATLYQLSYTPLGNSGFEPETSPLSGVRSNQLS
jgi:hypothetical protein